MPSIRKILISAIFITALSFVFLSLPESISAQVCTGDSGAAGTCMATMACSPPRIDGQGTCTLAGSICCLDKDPCGTVPCAGTCTDTSDCLCDYTCTGGFCTHPTICASCTGNSGFPGTCIAPGVCAGLGRNPDDGNTGCFVGSSCCTEAPSANSCALVAESPFLVGAVFWVNLRSTTPDTFYTMSAPGCTGSCFNVRTDDRGFARCSLSCGPPAGTYTITAKYSDVTCSETVDVLNEPGPPCTGVTTGRSGNCSVLACPRNRSSDGWYPAVCSRDGAACCVPDIAGSDSDILCDFPLNSIDTAIGCISVMSQRDFAVDILGKIMGIAGGVAFLLMVYAGFIIMTSSGDPKRLSAGKELLTAAITGLILLVTGAYFLRLIGVTILEIF